MQLSEKQNIPDQKHFNDQMPLKQKWGEKTQLTKASKWTEKTQLCETLHVESRQQTVKCSGCNSPLVLNQLFITFHDENTCGLGINYHMFNWIPYGTQKQQNYVDSYRLFCQKCFDSGVYFQHFMHFNSYHSQSYFNQVNKKMGEFNRAYNWLSTENKNLQDQMSKTKQEKLNLNRTITKIAKDLKYTKSVIKNLHQEIQTLKGQPKKSQKDSVMICCSNCGKKVEIDDRPRISKIDDITFTLNMDHYIQNCMTNKEKSKIIENMSSFNLFCQKCSKNGKYSEKLDKYTESIRKEEAVKQEAQREVYNLDILKLKSVIQDQINKEEQILEVLSNKQSVFKKFMTQIKIIKNHIELEIKNVEEYLKIGQIEHFSQIKQCEDNEDNSFEEYLKKIQLKAKLINLGLDDVYIDEYSLFEMEKTFEQDSFLEYEEGCKIEGCEENLTLHNIRKNLNKFVEQLASTCTQLTESLTLQLPQQTVPRPQLLLEKHYNSYDLIVNCSGCKRHLFVEVGKFRKISSTHFKLGINCYITNALNQNLQLNGQFIGFCRSCYQNSIQLNINEAQFLEYKSKLFIKESTQTQDHNKPKKQRKTKNEKIMID